MSLQGQLICTRSSGNADGKGGTGGPFGMGKDPMKIDLLSQYCATGTCTDAQVKQILQTQNELQHAAGENATAVVKAGATGIGAAAAVAGLATVPGAPILSTAGALGSEMWASAFGTGAISAAISAGSQYAQTGSINWVDVAGAYGAGYAGPSGGLLWNMGVNAFGGATTTALNNILQGKNDSVAASALSSGVLSSLGYGIGKAGESGVNTFLKPGINTSTWAATGVWSSDGWNLFRPNSAGVVGGSVLGGMGQEAAGAAIPSINNTGGQRK